MQNYAFLYSTTFRHWSQNQLLKIAKLSFLSSCPTVLLNPVTNFPISLRGLYIFFKRPCLLSWYVSKILQWQGIYFWSNKPLFRGHAYRLGMCLRYFEGRRYNSKNNMLFSRGHVYLLLWNVSKILDVQGNQYLK